MDEQFEAWYDDWVWQNSKYGPEELLDWQLKDFLEAGFKAGWEVRADLER